jgi:Meckel syndrome type 1 protein
MPTDPERRVGVRIALGTVVLGALFLQGGAPLLAQTHLGPSKCVGCHDHERQARKWQKEEPAAFKGKAHYNTLKQLDAPKSAQWAKAVGLADPYDVKGSCVKCHGTVFRGDANAGVSCESCHGPSSKWNDLHQQKGAYAQSVAAGLVDLKEKPATIAKVCVECHVLADKRLATAGHPTGATFDAGVSLQKLVHWDRTYSYPGITAAGKAAMGGRALSGGAAVAPSAPAAVTPAGKAAAAPAGAKAAPAPAEGAQAPPAAAPAAAIAVAPPAGAPAAAAPKRAAVPAAPAAPPAPWDWDQPIRALPDDYVPEPAEPAAAATTVTGAASSDETPAPDVPASAPAPAPARRPVRVAPVVPPSLAEETPLPAALPGAPAVAAVAPAVEATAVMPAAARPPAAEAAALRGEAVRVLEKLVRSGARTKDAAPPAKPAEYSGPDGELLRLQDEVMALALESLRRPE